MNDVSSIKTPDYIYKSVIAMRDADAAGVLFYARYLALAHDAYEAFLASRNFSTAFVLTQTSWIIPVIHAEADYRRPLHVGEHYSIGLFVKEVRRRVFTITYDIRNSQDEVSCSALTRHVVVDRHTRKAVPVPDELILVLDASKNKERIS